MGSRPPWHAEWIASPRRVRAMLEHETVADSRRMMLLRQHGFLPVYYFPREDVRTDLLEPSEHTTFSPYKGVASYWTVRVGERRAESAAWSYLEPLPGSPDTRGYISFDFHGMDAWWEEDEQIFVHARDPYHRVDALPSSRHVSVEVNGVELAASRRPVLVFETGLITRYYLPREDVRHDVLEPSETFTMCPYKGRAAYVSARLDGAVRPDVAWYYPFPLRDVCAVENHLAFWNESCTITIDGVPEPAPAARDDAGGGERLEAKRRFFAVPVPPGMRGAEPGRRQHDFARPNGRAEGPPPEFVDMAVERAGGR